MNKIWIYLLIIGICFSFINGTTDIVGEIIIKSGFDAFNVFLKLSLLMIFWNGIFEIAKKTMLTKYATKILKKPLSYIFKDVDPNSECMEYITANVVSNMLGLGACATPLAFRVMELLQEKNDNKAFPSRDMVKFILINISTLSLIPTTIISLRQEALGKYDITFLCMIVSFFSFTITLIIEGIVYAIKRVIK